ncbi:MAG: M48 family metalloprotease [Thalassobaculales bacterium]
MLARLIFCLSLLLAAVPAAAQFMTPENEAEIGRQEHPKILKEFGGAYPDPALGAYVAGIGLRLARASDRPDIAYTVTVLNAAMVNAFALPGGYVYVTRGLMALADTEAELAGVLAHEIGHVTARHSAARYNKGMLAQLGVGILGALGGGGLAQALGLGAQVYLQGFSREQEFEADQLGVRTLVRAAYRPEAMAGFLAKLGDQSRVDAQMAGRPPGEVDRFDMMATHPRTPDRVGRAMQAAADLPRPDNASDGREEYLRRIDGMIYGDDPKEGLVRGRAFVHPALRLRFEVPPGFRLVNGSDQVAAYGPGGAAIRFTMARSRSADPAQHIAREWGANLPLGGVEALSVAGLPAAAARADVRLDSGPAVLRLVAIRGEWPQGGTAMYRFLFLSTPQAARELDRPFRDTVYSFRRLSAEEAAGIRPLRIRLHRVAPGDTPAALIARMPAGPFQAERFAALNGLPPGLIPPVGDLVKLVAE